MPSPLPESWPGRLALDRDHVWHPFTQMKDHELDPLIPVIAGEGCDLVLANGNRVLDGISSWWTCLHGHGHPKLMAALERQSGKLDHVIFAGFTHEPAIELVTRLRPKLTPNLTRCFFSDNGSTAVEVALKMAFQAQHQRGQGHRTRFGALHMGYHGDTLGAIGVGELDNFMTGLFRPLLLSCERLAIPEDLRRELSADLDGWNRTLETARQGIRFFFETHGNGMAAFIAEPLLQAAGGMRMWPPELLVELRAQCDFFGVYLILDEVMTGFGRTGSFFAHSQAGVAPDLLCLSKGLTGGVLPLSLTWATDEIYNCFWADYAEGKAFLHGHSYTANPLSCAVACASLALFEEQPVMEQAARLGETMKSAWGSLKELPAIRRPRSLGTVAAAQMVNPATGAPHPPESRFGWRLHRRALDAGLLIRPIGDCLYFMPPLGTPPSRAEEAVDIIADLMK